MVRLFALTAIAALASSVAAQHCNGWYNNETPARAVQNMQPGWNLGNTLDAVPYEDSWNNAKVQEYTFSDIKKAGFKSVRIPITWTAKTGPAPSYTIDATWLDRVEQVVDMALKYDLYVVINIHHDSWEWADLSTPDNLQGKKDRLYALWRQISARLNKKCEKVLFESLNEPVGGGDDAKDETHSNIYNEFNAEFVKIVRQSGGFNAKRNLLLPTLNTNIDRGIKWFKFPAQPDSNLILTVHNYDPWDFVSNSWGKTWWGTADDLVYFDNLYERLVKAFPNTAIVLGEFGTSKFVDKFSNWLWHDYHVRAAAKRNIAIQLWDNGDDYFDRVNRVWRDPVIKDYVINAAKLVPNSFLDKATLYFKEGEAITDKALKLNLNGNTFGALLNGQVTLQSGRDYRVENGTTLVLTQKYLSSVVKPAIGTSATLTAKFSKGTYPTLALTRYSTPIISYNSFTKTEPLTNALTIPTQFKGTTLATVKCVYDNGVYCKDDWTQWLGDLQKGRINYNDFWADATNVGLSAAFVNGLSQSANLTFEFYPREENVNLGFRIVVA
ncbi:hypothetical protein HK097_002017 [Rhizophlyctis rosea]|uniref:Uncharacterized protein n=1 Tax=Rhizophlyctis rosea TaxID=64517 RepID=A0AAD5SGM2_9FUNG|nr:hypothetical protein HK097_002017 [Rhizophlyctis rosea]